MNHKKKKNNNEQQQFEFCEVCRLNHNHGRRHNFFPSHKSSLSTFLTRFQSKLSDVKFFLKSPMHLRPDNAHHNRLWCVFCNFDILELGSSFACGNVIEHLSSEEHRKRVKGFMWKYGGEMDRVDLFCIAETDYVKWKKRCKSLKTEAAKAESVGPVVGPSNNIHNELNADYINNSFHKNSVDSLNFPVANGVVPLHSYTNERTQVSCSVPSPASEVCPSLYNMSGGIKVGDTKCLKNSTGYMDNQHRRNGSVDAGLRTNNEEHISPGLMNLTQISSTLKEAVEGNVHTGAPPPWFDSTKGNPFDIGCKPEMSDLVSSKAWKSSKLNPKRVGAAWAERRKLELELERRGELVNNKFDDANWLPNFGRVWQSGTRKESRKQFQMESKESLKTDNQSEALIPLQPYISKRMRRDTSDDTVP